MVSIKWLDSGIDNWHRTLAGISQVWVLNFLCCEGYLAKYTLLQFLFLHALYSAAELEKKEAEFEDSRLREYHCPVCDQVLHLSSIGILKHKRMHAKMK